MARVSKTRTPKRELDCELDDALKQTFPASDPVAIGAPTSAVPDRPVGRRPAAIDLPLVNKLAREVADSHRGPDKARSPSRSR